MDFGDVKLEDILLKEKNKVLNIIIILLSVLIAVNIYKAQARGITGIRELKDTEFKKNDVINEISQYEKNINAYQAFLKKKDTGEIINTIDDIATDCGVKIVSLKPSGAQDFPLYTKRPFELLVTAPGYHAVGKFIAELESHNDLYIIDSISMKIASDFTSEISAELTLSKISFKI